MRWSKRIPPSGRASGARHGITATATASRRWLGLVRHELRGLLAGHRASRRSVPASSAQLPAEENGAPSRWRRTPEGPYPTEARAVPCLPQRPVALSTAPLGNPVDAETAPRPRQPGLRLGSVSNIGEAASHPEVHALVAALCALSYLRDAVARARERALSEGPAHRGKAPRRGIPLVHRLVARHLPVERLELAGQIRHRALELADGA